MNHFLDIHTTGEDALRGMLDNALSMKAARDGAPKGTKDAEQPLANRMVALIFEKPSTRTRVSFDVGARQMGGETMVLSGADMQLGQGENHCGYSAGYVALCRSDHDAHVQRIYLA